MHGQIYLFTPWMFVPHLVIEENMGIVDWVDMVDMVDYVDMVVMF